MYDEEVISEERLAKWRAVQPHPELALPKPNPFIATDFSLACDQPQEVGSGR